MPYPVDPASLEGDELEQWYRRSPQEIEDERQAAEAQRYRDFFGDAGDGGSGVDASPGAPFEQQVDVTGQEPGSVAQPDFGSGSLGSSADASSGSSSFPHPVPMPSPPFGPSGAWPHPAPMPAPWDMLHPSGWRPTPLGRGPGYGPTMVAANAATNPASPGAPRAPQSSRPGGSPIQDGSASQPSRQAPLDPSRIDVFQPGADGKLHPVPGWHTTGPFDFGTWSHDINWGGVAKDLGDIGLGAATWLEGGGFAESLIDGLGHKIGPAVVQGIVEGHHSFPKFMGGAVDQELARIHHSLHTMFHADLRAALKDAGLPRIGGTGGSTEDWANFFSANPAKREEAMAILKRVTREFDRNNGTRISKYLDPALSDGQAPTPPTSP
ncbi:MAG: hypothetical protein E7812_00305 [Phenylobacterium sp.]|nr:MAG: hypothetical protein E7812_00305 [Phenylobacterium sp.]